jgi:hypothetical protein
VACAHSETAIIRGLITTIKSVSYSDERAEAINHLRQALGLLELRAWRRMRQGIDVTDDVSAHRYVDFPLWWGLGSMKQIEYLQTDPEGHIRDDAFVPQGGEGMIRCPNPNTRV